MFINLQLIKVHISCYNKFGRLFRAILGVELWLACVHSQCGGCKRPGLKESAFHGLY